MDRETQRELNNLNERLRDLRTYAGLLIVGGSIIFGIVAFIFNLRFSAEKEDLRKFSNDLKSEIYKELGKLGEPPKLEVYNLLKHEKLENSTIETIAEGCKGQRTCINLILTIKNIGGSISGPIYFKWYFNHPLIAGPPSSDEEEFDYEKIIGPEGHSLGRLPGHGFSTSYSIVHIMEVSIDKIKENTYPTLLKIYYGDGGELVERIEYKIKINKQ